jgi:hypothetical protein
MRRELSLPNARRKPDRVIRFDPNEAVGYEEQAGPTRVTLAEWETRARVDPEAARGDRRLKIVTRAAQRSVQCGKMGVT